MMKDTLIYLDQAATSWPKPASVGAAMQHALRTCGGNPGRGSHPLAEASSQLLYDCREAAAAFFNGNPEAVVFTLNATEALNMAIKGLAHKDGHILVDHYAHNAAARPVKALVQCGLCTMDLYDTNGTAEETLASIRALMRPETTMLIATHQSNICSHVLPIREIGALCRERGIDYIVDGSQSAGHLPIDIEADGITALCLPGHKGLMGPMGTGMLLTREDAVYRTIIEGGAGIRSLDETMPENLPERLEPGTMATPAIAGLLAGIRYVQSVGLARIRRTEESLAAAFVNDASKIGGLHFHGETAGSVVSFTVDGASPSEIGRLLGEAGICVRTGYHCAPLAHEALGTLETGTVRVSFSGMNTTEEARTAARVLERITEGFRSERKKKS